MTPDPDNELELYKLYLATAEKVSDRRAQANVWMLSVNSAIVALYGYLLEDKSLVGEDEALLRRLAIPVAGILNSLTWATMLTSYRKLNAAKFKVMHEMEARMSYAPFTQERLFYKQEKRRTLSGAEAAVPWSFMTLYFALILITLTFSLD